MGLRSFTSVSQNFMYVPTASTGPEAEQLQLSEKLNVKGFVMAKDTDFCVHWNISTKHYGESR